MKKTVTFKKTFKDDAVGKPLAVFLYDAHGKSQTGMLLECTRKKGTQKSFLTYAWSADGFEFAPDEREVTLHTHTGRKEKIDECSAFSVAHITQGYVLTYIRTKEPAPVKVRKTKKPAKKTLAKKPEKTLVTAFSKDLYEWKIRTEEETDSDSATFVYDGSIDKYIQYRDGLFLRQKSSPKFGHWPVKSVLLATARSGHFDSGTLTLMGSQMTDRGIVLVYDAPIVKKHDDDEQTLVQAGLILLDRKHSDRVVWRSESVLFQSIIEHTAGASVRPIGAVSHKELMRLYWLCPDGVILVASVPAFFKEAPVATAPVLKRSIKNPIISPAPHNAWEVEGTFNPGAFADEQGRVHLLYRAIGSDGISRVGYARSTDGVHFNYRYPYPVFEPSLASKRTLRAAASLAYNPAMYTSGGGWGGAEDPRVVRIGDTIYMMYVAFEGWDSVRIALTSISVDDFMHERWSWKPPVLISAPGTVNKNWLLFPEKINGKYVILHSIAPQVAVEYIESLDSFTGATFIKSLRKGGPQPGREGKWDGLLRGAGAPPLKTRLGWLLLYHALDVADPGRYKLGAMILDVNDPTKVLYRSAAPILSPDEVYENNGKPGIVYASGAVIRGDDVYVYYGGADRVVCVATAPLADLLDYIVTGKPKEYKLKKSEMVA